MMNKYNTNETEAAIGWRAIRPKLGSLHLSLRPLWKGFFISSHWTFIADIKKKINFFPSICLPFLCILWKVFRTTSVDSFGKMNQSLKDKTQLFLRNIEEKKKFLIQFGWFEIKANYLRKTKTKDNIRNWNPFVYIYIIFKQKIFLIRFFTKAYSY